MCGTLRSYRFFCSSILIVYEGSTLRPQAKEFFEQHHESVLSGKEDYACRHFFEHLAEKKEDDNESIEEMYGQYLRQHPTMFLPQSTDKSQLVQVKVIDMAHSLLDNRNDFAWDSNTDPSRTYGTMGGEGDHVKEMSGGVDNGYIHGLVNLISMLEDIVHQIDSECAALHGNMSTFLESINNRRKKAI